MKVTQRGLFFSLHRQFWNGRKLLSLVALVNSINYLFFRRCCRANRGCCVNTLLHFMCHLLCDAMDMDINPFDIQANTTRDAAVWYHRFLSIVRHMMVAQCKDTIFLNFHHIQLHARIVMRQHLILFEKNRLILLGDQLVRSRENVSGYFVGRIECIAQ